MLLCLIFGCGTKSGRDEGVSFARVPVVVKNQGEQAETLSTERRTRWIRAISREDITEDILNRNRVCLKHFISGKAAKDWDKFNIDWVPSLNLGHDRKWAETDPQNGADRMQRAYKKEGKRKAQQERERLKK